MKNSLITTIVCAAALGIISVAAWFFPGGDYSDSERRKLAEFPELSTSAVLSGKFMEGFEDYSLDRFPARDEVRTLKALCRFYLFAQKDNNDIYLSNGYAAKLEYPLSENSVKNATEHFKKLYETYLKESGSKIYAAVVPDKGYYLAEQGGYPAMDYETLFSMIREEMSYAESVDLTGVLQASDYYKTDTHWRQEKLLPVAKKLASALGIMISEEFHENTAEIPFYGVYYGQSALPLKGETLHYLTNPVMDGCEVYNYETGKTGGIYDMEKLHGKDPYELFLSGSAALLTITNPNATTQKELIVFRDSFASSLVPLLTQDYAKITLVDIRYISSDYIGEYLSFTGQDVLFLYSTLILNDSYTLK